VEIDLTNPYLAQQLPDDLPRDPMHWAKAWLDEATRRNVQRNPNSMTLATVDGSGRPSSRVVLCKSFQAEPGYLVFYTNYKSRKVTELGTNPGVAVTFHWDAIGRQIRIEGLAVRSPDDESDAYFASRDWGSQVGAWASDQSAPIGSRDALLQQLRERARKLGADVSDDMQSLLGDERPAIVRPEHWGGIRVWAESVELWIEGRDRIHERGRWQRTLTPASDHAFTDGDWLGTRLQP
jgi:pyridoxamine 5'-phosphate oxidase